MRNYVASFMIYDATFSKQSLSNCDAKPALPCLGLSCTRKKNSWDSSSPASYCIGNERFSILWMTCFPCSTSPYWVKTFSLFLILCLQPICTATNPLAHTFHIFQTDGSLGMNYTWFHSQPKPRHSVIITDKRAHRSASFGHCFIFALIKCLMDKAVA